MNMKGFPTNAYLVNTFRYFNLFIVRYFYHSHYKVRSNSNGFALQERYKHFVQCSSENLLSFVRFIPPSNVFLKLDENFDELMLTNRWWLQATFSFFVMSRSDSGSRIKASMNTKRIQCFCCILPTHGPRHCAFLHSGPIQWLALKPASFKITAVPTWKTRCMLI